MVRNCNSFHSKSIEQTITFTLCFITQCKFNDLNDSFEIKWNITNLIFAVVVCDVWSPQLLINNLVFIILYERFAIVKT